MEWDLISLLIAGIAVMLVLALGIIFFVVLYQRRVFNHQLEIKSIEERKQQELLQATIQSEEEERMRIASELHDDVGITLSSVKLFLHQAAQNPDPELIRESRELLEESIQKIRNISHSLQPGILQHLGLQASIQSFAEMISKTGSIAMKYEPEGELPPLGGHISLAIYRVIQELVNNVIKHSGATRIHLHSAADTRVKIVMTHNGEGLDDAGFRQLVFKPGAIGLKNIVNRLESVGGSILFSREDGGNYKVVFVVPINN